MSFNDIINRLSVRSLRAGEFGLILSIINFNHIHFSILISAANNYGCSEELLEKRPCSNLPLCEPREPTGTFNPFEWTSSYSSGVYDNKFEIKNRLSGSSYLYDGSNSNAPNNMYQPSNQQYRGGYNNRVQRPSYSDNYGTNILKNLLTICLIVFQLFVYIKRQMVA